jgi:hypothetical protein
MFTLVNMSQVNKSQVSKNQKPRAQEPEAIIIQSVDLTKTYFIFMAF